MPKNMVIDDNSQNLNPTQQQELISLQKQMAEHMLGNARKGYKHFSPIEKIRWANKAVNLVADYTCLKMGIDRSKIDLAFFTGAQPNAFATRLGNNGERYGVAMSIQNIIRNNPVAIFKNAFHEFRHIAQYDGKTPQTESVSHYNGPYTKTDWGSSPSEIGADRFAYKEISGLLGRGLLKASTAVKSLVVAPNVYYASLDNSLNHMMRSGIHFFSRNKYSRDLTKLESDIPTKTTTGKVLKSEPGHFFDIKEIEDACEGSYLFFKDQTIATKRQLKDKAQKVAESLNRSYEQRHNDEFSNTEGLSLQPENNAMLQSETAILQPENLDLQPNQNLGVEEIVSGILKAKTKDEDVLTIETLTEENGKEVAETESVDLPNQTALENLTETTVDLKTTEDVATPATVVKPVDVTPDIPIQ